MDSKRYTGAEVKVVGAVVPCEYLKKPYGDRDGFIGDTPDRATESYTSPRLVRFIASEHADGKRRPKESYLFGHEEEVNFRPMH